MKPQISYIVCSTQRSGSGILCEALWNTNLAGKPDEYFFSRTEKKYSTLWKTSSYSDYLNKVMYKGMSGNGVFGVKIMWSHLRIFMEKVLKLPQFSHLSSQTLLANLFPNLHYIWITRCDKVRQAISYYKNLQTGIHSWCDDRTPEYEKPLKFNFKAIDRFIRRFYEEEACWQQFFELHGVCPLKVVYEENIEHGYEDIVKQILSYLSIPIPVNLPLFAKRRKQSDELTEKFVRIYKRQRSKTKGLEYDAENNIIDASL